MTVTSTWLPLALVQLCATEDAARKRRQAEAFLPRARDSHRWRVTQGVERQW